MAEEISVKRKGSPFAFRIRVEPRLEEINWWQSLLITLSALVIALLIGAILLKAVGGDPWEAYAHIAKASFGSVGVFSDTMVKAIPLIMVGLASTVAFKMKLWNIGSEGQFYLGAFGASMVVLLPVLPEDSPKWLFILVMMIFGIAFGALWGFIPGFLKVKFRVNEVISTLMMNYIAVKWNDFFIYAVWSEGGFQMSKMFPKNAWLPRLTDYGKIIPEFRGLTTHMGLLFALVAVVIVWFILYRSKWGYEIRLIGDNPKAANYAGVQLNRNIIGVMMLSGGLAGLAGMSEISGVVHRLQGAISPGYGFTGIIVAWLAKLNPYLVIIVSVLFGALILAGREIQPSGIPKLIQGIILVCLIASDYLVRNRIHIMKKAQD